MRRIRTRISAVRLLSCNGKRIKRYAFVAVIALTLASCGKMKPMDIVDTPASTKSDVGCEGNDPLAQASWRIYCWKYNVDPEHPTSEQENSYLDWYMGSYEESSDLDSVMTARETHLKIERKNGVTNVYTED